MVDQKFISLTKKEEPEVNIFVEVTHHHIL